MKKITKLLSVFVIAGAVSAGAGVMAGCSHKHTYSDDWKADGANGHYHVATCEHTTEHTATEAHVDLKVNATGAEGKDNKCDLCDYEITPSGSDNTGDKIALPAGVNALIVEGVTTEYTLSATATSANIPLTGFKVYFAAGNEKKDEVPAANWKAQLYKGSSTTPLTDTSAIKEDGGYTLGIELVNVTGGENIAKDVPIKVNNPITEIALKTGTTTQAQSVTDSMTSTWTFEATRANGDKEAVVANLVTISSIDTTKAGTGSATLTYGGAVLGSVNYEVTADNTQVTQSFALNFNSLTAAQETLIKEGEAVSLQDGRFEILSVGSGSIDSHNKSADGKYFAKRLKTNGDSNASKATRYIKVKVDGSATLTVYAYNNSNDATGRSVSVYGAADFTDDKAVFTEQVGETKEIAAKVDTKIEFTIPKAGVYYITNIKAMCYTYVQLDQLVSSEGNQKIELGGTVETSKLSVKYSGEGEHHVDLGTTFDSVKSLYTVKATGVNNVTCDSADTDVTADCTFDVPADFETVPGSKEITVSYGGQTATITIIVDSAVPGVSGITSKLKITVSTQVASAEAKFKLTKEDVENAIVGENANATIESFKLIYNDTEIGAEGYEFAVSDTAYEVIVEAVVKAGEATATLSAKISFTVSVASVSNEQSFLAPDTVPATATLAKDDVITENNLFKAVADAEMEYSVGASESNGIPNSSKPVKVELQDGSEKTFKTGIRTAKSADKEVATTTVTFIAKAKITLRIYAICCNDSYNSNKAGKLIYSIDNGSPVSVDSGSDRQKPNTISVTLEAGQTLKLHATGNAEGVRLYLFGIEAKAAASATAASLEALPPKQED